MGQNLAIIWSTAPLGPEEGSYSSRIQNWFNEVQKYAWGSSWTPKTGHYSQVRIPPDKPFEKKEYIRIQSNFKFSLCSTVGLG